VFTAIAGVGDGAVSAKVDIGVAEGSGLAGVGEELASAGVNGVATGSAAGVLLAKAEVATGCARGSGLTGAGVATASGLGADRGAGASGVGSTLKVGKGVVVGLAAGAGDCGASKTIRFLRLDWAQSEAGPGKTVKTPNTKTTQIETGRGR